MNGSIGRLCSLTEYKPLHYVVVYIHTSILPCLPLRYGAMQLCKMHCTPAYVGCVYRCLYVVLFLL